MVPRNTLVLIELIETKERKIGNIVVSTNADQIGEADIIAVGPGTMQIPGARSETFDLVPGQRVLVKHQDVKMMGGQLIKAKVGFDMTDGGKKRMLVEQTSILCILAEVVSPLFQTPALPGKIVQ